MEVELALDIDQYEEEYYEPLMNKGWGDYAYKRAYLPVVFPGLKLSVGFVNSKGEKSGLTFVVIDAFYYLDQRILVVYIKFDESPFLMAEMVTEENGWSKSSVLRHKSILR